MPTTSALVQLSGSSLIITVIVIVVVVVLGVCVCAAKEGKGRRVDRGKRLTAFFRDGLISTHGRRNSLPLTVRGTTPVWPAEASVRPWPSSAAAAPSSAVAPAAVLLVSSSGAASAARRRNQYFVARSQRLWMMAEGTSGDNAGFRSFIYIAWACYGCCQYVLGNCWSVDLFAVKEEI